MTAPRDLAVLEEWAEGVDEQIAALRQVTGLAASREPLRSEFGELSEAVHCLLVGLGRLADGVAKQLGGPASGLDRVAYDRGQVVDDFHELIDSIIEGRDLFRRNFANLSDRCSKLEQRFISGHDGLHSSVAGNPEGRARRDSATAPGAPTSDLDDAIRREWLRAAKAWTEAAKEMRSSVRAASRRRSQ